MIVMTSTRGLLIQELQVTWHLTRIFSSSLIQKSQKGYVLLADGVKKVQVEGKGSGFINYPANYVVLALCFKNPLTSYNVSILWCCGISTYYFPWEFAFLHSWWSLSVVFCLVLMKLLLSFLDVFDWKRKNFYISQNWNINRSSETSALILRNFWWSNS